MPRCLLWKRVPGYTIPMVPMHLPPMAPMNLVEQIRALRVGWCDGFRGDHDTDRGVRGKRRSDAQGEPPLQ